MNKNDNLVIFHSGMGTSLIRMKKKIPVLIWLATLLIYTIYASKQVQND